MKKSTLNAIMQGVIIVLVIAIVFVIIKIQLRPDEVPVTEIASEENTEQESVVEEVSEPEPELVIEERVRIVNDNINVRSGPGTDYERLGSAYTGYDFEFIEQLEEGWTKIVYDDREAYVYSEYVEIIPMVLDEEGNYTEYVDLDSDATMEDDAELSEDAGDENSEETSDTEE